MAVGRNQKNNADYFSHDADASTDEKLVYLESIFGHTGYALYFKFLECMTRADDFKLKWDEIKKAVYAAKFSVSVTEIEQFVTECCRDEIKAFVVEDGHIYSPGLIKRFSALIAKREYNRQKYQEQKQEDEIQLQKKEIQKQKRHSKVKESRGKESNKYIYSSEPKTDSEQPIVEIPLVSKNGDGKPQMFCVMQPYIEELQDTYPGVKIIQALKEIRQWNTDNPNRRKTQSGIRKHISNWLKKEQNRAPAKAPKQKDTYPI